MAILSLRPAPCAECGSEPVFHTRDYVMLFVNTAMMPFFASLHEAAFAPFKKISAGSGSISWVPAFLDLLALLHIGSYKDAYDDKTLLLDQVLWDEAKKRDIVMREFRLFNMPVAAFVAQRPGGRRIAFSSFPVPPSAPEVVWWIDQKNIMKKKFLTLGIPTPRGCI